MVGVNVGFGVSVATGVGVALLASRVDVAGNAVTTSLIGVGGTQLAIIAMKNNKLSHKLIFLIFILISLSTKEANYSANSAHS